MQKLLPFVVGVDGGEALHTGGDVGEERGLRDIVQTLQLSNQDSGERTSSVSAGREQLRRHPLPWRTRTLPLYLDTMCRTAKRMTRGATATRNHGKTPVIIPTQKNTRMTFWMNISAWKGRRTSTGDTVKRQGSGCGGPQTGKPEPEV